MQLIYSYPPPPGLWLTRHNRGAARKKKRKKSTDYTDTRDPQDTSTNLTNYTNCRNTVRTERPFAFVEFVQLVDGPLAMNARAGCGVDNIVCENQGKCTYGSVATVAHARPDYQAQVSQGRSVPYVPKLHDVPEAIAAKHRAAPGLPHIPTSCSGKEYVRVFPFP